MIDPVIDIKKEFELRFRSLLDKEPVLKRLILEIFVNGTAYVVGGYLRDFLNRKESRDIDIIVDLDNVNLLDIINDINCIYTENRHGGIKIQLEKISIDLWSLENNWAFKNKLVKLNENNKLFSIAKGCFFNFDSLVINLHNYTYNIKFYKEFLNRRTLDILQKSSIYKNLNPTIEANIIRAFFIKQKYDILFSTELIEYIVKKTEHLSLRYNGGIQRIIDIKANYPKYRELVDRCFIEELESIVKAKKKDANDLFLDI